MRWVNTALGDPSINFVCSRGWGLCEFYEEPESMQITEELIEAGKSDRGGWNAEQLRYLGLEWPLRPGWKNRVIGRAIGSRDAERFIELRGMTIRQKKKRSVIKTDLPIPPGFPVQAETVLASFWIFLSKLDAPMKRKVAPILEYMLRKLNQ